MSISEQQYLYQIRDLGCITMRLQLQQILDAMAAAQDFSKIARTWQMIAAPHRDCYPYTVGDMNIKEVASTHLAKFVHEMVKEGRVELAKMLEAEILKIPELKPVFEKAFGPGGISGKV